MDNDKKQLGDEGPNLLANSVRHKRVFLKSLFSMRSIIMNLIPRSFSRRATGTVVPQSIRINDPFKKLLRQTVIVCSGLLIVTSIVPSRILETGYTADYFETGTDFVQEGDELPLPPFLMNEEGFVLKSSPVSEDVSRIGLTDSVKHTVGSGETLSSIAALYSVNVKTLVWENNLVEESTLKIGQVLTIPPVNGVGHTIGKNETLASIAKDYGVAVALIKEHNKLQSDKVEKGQKLFVPGGKKKEPIIVVRPGTTGVRISSVNTFDPKFVMSTEDEPAAGGSLIFPTSGNITQGFRSGHYALDIGNSSKPDVWSSAPGVVIYANNNCQPREVSNERKCGGGYGNHVIVDHGNGLKTLYGHLETVYVVENQSVDRGQALGKMGNTGRVYGQTGIHLHFEVHDNGVKKNPSRYF